MTEIKTNSKGITGVWVKDVSIYKATASLFKFFIIHTIYFAINYFTLRMDTTNPTT